ncbi:hypothetical protein K445DRAFT_168361 [Daldinia sp. EC12]|nr:hypothetical protein K445DRAFT_168361 [Daldinia sp. EC12]
MYSSQPQFEIILASYANITVKVRPPHRAQFLMLPSTLGLATSIFCYFFLFPFFFFILKLLGLKAHHPARLTL